MPRVTPTKEWSQLLFSRRSTDHIPTKAGIPEVGINDYLEKQLRQEKERTRILALTRSISAIYSTRPFTKCEIRCDRCNDESLIHVVVNGRGVMHYQCEGTCGTYYRGPIIQKKGRW